MTTVVFRDGVLAADSQLSLTTDAGFGYKEFSARKLFEVEGWLIGISGNPASAQRFLLFMRRLAQAAPGEDVETPMLEDDDIDCLVIDPDGQVFSVGVDLAFVPMDGDYFAIGTGAPYALVALGAGASAEDAVRAAAGLDLYTGGRIQTRIQNGRP